MRKNNSSYNPEYSKFGRCLMCDTIKDVNEDRHCEECNNRIKEMQRIRNNKPPLGLQPHKYWVEERITNILQAVNRYIEDDREIPTEWIEEYNQLIKESREIK